MQWLLLMITVTAAGEIETTVLSKHDYMSQCHVAGTYINWEERMPVNKEMLCLPTDIEVK